MLPKSGHRAVGFRVYNHNTHGAHSAHGDRIGVRTMEMMLTLNAQLAMMVFFTLLPILGMMRAKLVRAARD